MLLELEPTIGLLIRYLNLVVVHSLGHLSSQTESNSKELEILFSQIL